MVAAAVLLLGGAGGALALSQTGGDEDDPKPTPSIALSTPPPYTPPTLPNESPSVPAPTDTGPLSLFLIEAGDCIRNKGTTSSPRLEKSDCDASGDVYKVLKKFMGTRDKNKCRGVRGTDVTWYPRSSTAVFKFVLCTKKV